MILVTYGNPYAVGTFSDAESILVAYDQSIETVCGVVRVMKGEQKPVGRLPITAVPIPYGSGIGKVPK